MRLGMISQVYDPESGSPAVAGAISRALATLGHEIHVLTSFPNYPTGRIYPGYRIRPYQYEWRSGVHVHRVPLLPSHDRSMLRRSATYLSFAVSGAMRLSILQRVDAWLVYSSAATAALPALVARWLYGRPYVLLVQDMWPDSVVHSGFVRPGRLVTAAVHGLSAFCDASYRRASAVVAISPGMADLLGQRGVPPEKLAVVPNWVDESVFRPVPRDQALAERLGVAGGFVVMYAGSLGELHGLEAAIEAVRLLPDLPQLRLVLAGSGVAEPRLRAEAAPDAARIRFLGPQPPAQMAALMALSDLQLVTLRDLPVFRAALPSKVQAALACGRPMVAAARGDAANLVERSGAGFTVAPGDPAALAGAVRRLHALGPSAREAMGRAGRRYYLDHLSERVGAAALAEVLVRAATASRGYVPVR